MSEYVSGPVPMGEEPVVNEAPVEEAQVEEAPVETEEPVSVQEVISNVKDILTTEPVKLEEHVKSYNDDKFNELVRIIQALGFRDQWNSRLSVLKTSTESDSDKLRELIDITKDWRFNNTYKKKLVDINHTIYKRNLFIMEFIYSYINFCIMPSSKLLYSYIKK